jgi:hypothetical protein
MEVMFQRSYETVKGLRAGGLKWRLALGKFFNENAISKGGMFGVSPGGCLMTQNEGQWIDERSLSCCRSM